MGGRKQLKYLLLVDGKIAKIGTTKEMREYLNMTITPFESLVRKRHFTMDGKPCLIAKAEHLYQFWMDGELDYEGTLMEASEDLEIPVASILDGCHSRRKLCHGYIVKQVDVINDVFDTNGERMYL